MSGYGYSEYDYQIDSGQRTPAVEIIYKDRNFKSKLEGKWAAYFDLLGVDFGYEIEYAFETPVGRYCPDFFIPSTGHFIEVKATRELLTESERLKIKFLNDNPPEYAQGVITVFGEPNFEQYGELFCIKILGVNRTQSEINSAIVGSINTVFIGGKYIPIKPVYKLDYTPNPYYDKLLSQISKKKNQKGIVKKVFFGDIKNVERKAEVRIKLPYELRMYPMLDSVIKGWQLSIPDVPDDVLKYCIGLNAVYKEMQNELLNLTIKPYPVDSCFFCNLSSIQRLGKYWDLCIDIKFGGGYFVKTKLKNDVIKAIVKIVLPGVGNTEYNSESVFIKVIPKIESFSSTIREMIGYIKCENFKSRFVIYTPDTRYREQFESHGIIIVSPSEIGV